MYRGEHNGRQRYTYREIDDPGDNTGPTLFMVDTLALAAPDPNGEFHQDHQRDEGDEPAVAFGEVVYNLFRHRLTCQAVLTRNQYKSKQ